jgi:hypothetical protein
MRGNTPRIYRNTLVFFAADNTRLQELGDAVRFYLAWESILGEREALDLSPYQVRQAEAQRISANSAIDVRLPEAYQWLLVPVQSSPQAEIEWQDIRLNGREPIAERASRKLRSDELLVTGLCGNPPAHGSGSNSSLARRSCGYQTAYRRLFPLPLPVSP